MLKLHDGGLHVSSTLSELVAFLLCYPDWGKSDFNEEYTQQIYNHFMETTIW